MDPSALERLHAACFTTPRPWSAAEFADLIRSRHCFLLCAAQGFLLGRVIADEAELLTLAVDPQSRRQGIGAKLVSDFLTTARARGATTAFLEVAANNNAAQVLYARTGWTKAGRRKGYYHAPDGTAEDALVLVQTL
ncbi:ribosomal-protein-alanine N-acetyltransferase [Rhodobacter sp. TJ_12]|uniref:ribosomal protein S18-alanine N-acetyltransferase n=1 Tax=Rhodobacter sp. TJ_12 TaxID=2029399 RepID=UPI001CBE4D42|nr:ribosomal protein S18-alanine N-acetyltransferase [Rhodobacter sp. TJ_12]MBZ4022576.1 ribosomal-protein-alanine N-acetyltransferase [Rhodobacter sp. TJ_12]